ncbi:MAG: GerMN domain-containing protein [Acidobacteria bacterium]|nr:GerMN domain-containing protein [Acidobacteriota bacterium]MBV9145866.1 GerMN domain-containing protein [Acidobacteriota bacterium]MBV9436905.1 GerMN domain-containing protein [Acidobacteriota bacterium]
MIPRHVQIALVLLLGAVLVSGIYILMLRRVTEESLRRASDQRPVASQIQGAKAIVKLTVAYDDEDVFRLREVNIPLPAEPTARARAVLQTLLAQYLDKPSPHPVGQGSAVNNVFIVDRTFAVIDMNPALADGHRSGIMVEDLTLMSLIDTLAANFPEIQRVKFLIDGKERETLAGHADLHSIYSTAVVHNLVTQLQ